MSTPIKSNTEELQEILQTVYNLPNKSSGSSTEPDLVIDFILPEGKWTGDVGQNESYFSIKSGSAADTYTKLSRGQEVNVYMKCDYYYGNLHYIGTYYPIATTAEVSDGKLGFVFLLHSCPGNVYSKYVVSMGITTDGVVDYICAQSI